MMRRMLPVEGEKLAVSQPTHERRAGASATAPLALARVRTFVPEDFGKAPSKRTV